jgi:3-hydroxybutyryl-CoA dehydrogenase
MIKVSVIGAGTMGMGIAQIAATQGHQVCLYDNYDGAIENAKNKLEKILNRLVEKEKITSKEKDEIIGRINFSKELAAISESNIIMKIVLLVQTLHLYLLLLLLQLVNMLSVLLEYISSTLHH